MIITWIGSIIIISIILIIGFKKSLVPLAIVVAPLQGSSVININHLIIGISPYYFVLFFIFFQVFFRLLDSLRKGRLRKRYHTNLMVEKYFFFLTIFLMWSGFSLLFPFLFEGIKVYVPRQGILDELGSLSFSMSNIAQFIYLTLNIIFIQELYRYSINKTPDFLVKLILICGCFVVAIGLWDFSNIGFPRSFFLNNITSTLESVKDYQIIGRVASTFSEPSFASAFFVSFLMMCLVSLFTLKESFFINIFLIITTSFLVFATFATTAYLATFMSLFLLIFCINLAIFAKKDESEKPLENSTKKIRIFLILMSIGLFLYILIHNIENTKFLVNALNDVVFKKNESLSAIYRNNSNNHGYKLLMDTFGMGVGIGGNRPSSFPAYLASNFGILGVLFYGINLFLISFFTVKNLIHETSLSNQKIFLLWSANFIAMSL